MNAFTVTTEKFSGPIDVLLKMIEKRKMPINDISLADITDDYLRFVQGLEEHSLSQRTHFIFVAAVLTLIKSKSLLPTLDLTHEEEQDIDDLKRRIELLSNFQKGAKNIKDHFNISPYFHYFKTPKREIFFQPHSSIDQRSVHEALLSVLKQVPEKEPKKKEAYVKIAIHIDEMMHSLEERIRLDLKNTTFDNFIGGEIKNKQEAKEVRIYKVVGFLAMLELVKNGVLGVLQEKNFSTIEIEKI
ncbi:MAG: segregation and condensation protein A [Candidatus Paceibacteria bacterium]|jgi:segregation and condensation protein A